ncbi:hypothetical protein Pan216_30960 [Planctomycetes bacterium Pan216]|uniref:DUF4013 domain-containing protein n=2 Tax=Kolteria novifilia TaxID=2527975 RepID=A0A518B5I7_9BACT|nr:hypothetical protein Pan216_30960 [Planctomycetes bacterium Pan216]
MLPARSALAESPTFPGAEQPGAGLGETSLWRRRVLAPFRSMGRLISNLFAVLALVGMLAVVAAIPLVQILVLGYFLEASGRVARTGKFRHGLPGLPLARRFGLATLCIALLLLPATILGSLHDDALLIAPNATRTEVLGIVSGLVGLATLGHLCLALLLGAEWHRFVRPIANLREAYRRLRERRFFRSVWENATSFVRQLHLPKLAWLGLKGFVLTLVWLVIPSAMLAAGGNRPIVSLLGGLAMMIVVLYVPFAQAHFAAEQRWRAIVDLRTVRYRFARAPMAFLLALVLTLLMTIPLYLMKVEMLPRDILWLPTLIFVVTILPLHLITSWAYSRGIRRERPVTWMLRWPCRLLMLPVATMYAYVVFLSQYTSWRGAMGLFEHHAFLVPAPF